MSSLGKVVFVRHKIGRLPWNLLPRLDGINAVLGHSLLLIWMSFSQVVYPKILGRVGFGKLAVIF